MSGDSLITAGCVLRRLDLQDGRVDATRDEARVLDGPSRAARAAASRFARPGFQRRVSPMQRFERRRESGCGCGRPPSPRRARDRRARKRRSKPSPFSRNATPAETVTRKVTSSIRIGVDRTRSRNASRRSTTSSSESARRQQREFLAADPRDEAERRRAPPASSGRPRGAPRRRRDGHRRR